MVDTLLRSRSDAQPPGFRELSPLAAVHHLGQLRLIDVREPDEYHGPLGHLPGAELVPLSTVTAAAAGWDRDVPLLLICRSGGRSTRAATLLAGMGFQHLYNLTGGMLAWDANELPRQGGRDELAVTAGQLHACFIAMAGGQVELGTAWFNEGLGQECPTAAGLRRAVAALRPTDAVSAEECASWVHQFERRLAAGV